MIHVLEMDGPLEIIHRLVRVAAEVVVEAEQFLNQHVWTVEHNASD